MSSFGFTLDSSASLAEAGRRSARASREIRQTAEAIFADQARGQADLAKAALAQAIKSMNYNEGEK